MKKNVELNLIFNKILSCAKISRMKHLYFCTLLEARLRFVCRVREKMKNNLTEEPNGKLPCVALRKERQLCLRLCFRPRKAEIQTFIYHYVLLVCPKYLNSFCSITAGFHLCIHYFLVNFKVPKVFPMLNQDQQARLISDGVLCTLKLCKPSS